MKKSKKILTRVLSMILAMTMMIGIFSTSAGAAESGTEESTGNLIVTFVTDGHATVDLYYSKDNYTSPDETSVTSAYVRGKGSTEIDNSGNGQVNFRVNVDDGYTYEITVVPENGYNNCKGEEETEVADIWRITKITADLTVTITTTASESGDDEKSETAAAADQTNISISVGSDETERNLTWYASAAGTGYLYVAKESDLTDGEMPETATVYTVTGAETNKTGYYSYQATMEDLDYSTTYAYQIVNGDTKSGIFTFTTGSGGDFSFAFAGDPQIGAGSTESDIEGWAKTLSIIASSSEFDGVDFLLSAGDQVNTASDEDQYDGYLNHEELESLTAATVIGNHDTSSSAYSEHFYITNASSYGTTNAGSDYYYVYNGVLFMVLNSNNTSAAEHKAFMEGAIAATADQDITWKIVTFHHSIYSVASHSLETSILTLREALVPVFEDLDIDVVLMGHDHVYCRTYIMDGLTEITDASEYDDEYYSSITDPDGILYVTANSASGSKYYSIKDYNFTYAAVMNQEQVPNVSRVDITDNSFTITTYRTSDMSVVDTFTIYHTDESDTDTESECDKDGHTTEIQNAKDATCTEDGYTGDEVCTVCGETVEKGETIPATGHTPVTDEAVAATCTEDGLTEGSHCSVCGAVITAQEVIPATGHTTETQNAKDATCTEDGYTGDEVCTVCGETVKEGEIIPATGHTPVTDAAVAATCTETGLTEGSHCSVCGEVLVAQEVIPATGHVWDEGVIVTEAPSYTQKGIKTYTCTVCGETKDEVYTFINGEVTDNVRTAILWAAESGISKGYTTGADAGTFGVGNTVTREEMVIFLYRLAGNTGEDTSARAAITFNDADEIKTSGGETAISWAVAEGITSGYSDGSGNFGPQDECTREQICIFLWRLAGKPAVTEEELAAVSDFADADEISNTTAKKAIAWAYSEGIIKGFTSGENAGKFCPTDSCLREQFAIMMYRYAN